MCAGEAAARLVVSLLPSPYPLLVLLPAILPAEVQLGWLIGLVFLSSIPGTALAIAFNAMFAAAVPPGWRGHVVGWRQSVLALTTASSSLLCGYLLDRLPSPLNYQVVYAIGTLGAAWSTWHLARIPMPESRKVPTNGLLVRDVPRPGLLRWWDALRTSPGLRFLLREEARGLLRWDVVRGPYGRLLVAYLCFYTFQYVPIPLFPLFVVNVLALPDGAIGVGNALFYGSMLVAATQLGRLSARWGHRRVLAASSLAFGAYPLLLGLAWDATLYWAASLGGAWCGLTPAAPW